MVTLFFAKKFLTKTNQCAEALSCNGETNCWFSIFRGVSF